MFFVYWKCGSLLHPMHYVVGSNASMVLSKRHRTKQPDTWTDDTDKAKPGFVCKTVMESMSWMAFVVSQLAALTMHHSVQPAQPSAELSFHPGSRERKWLLEFASMWSSMSLSTCFSGIGSPELGTHMIDNWLHATVGHEYRDMVSPCVNRCYCGLSNGTQWRVVSYVVHHASRTTYMTMSWTLLNRNIANICIA